MIYGTGTDMIEVSRVKKSIETIKGFKEKIFSQREIEYCSSKKRQYEHFAARFSAKESFFKAIGTGWRNGLGFNEIEVLNNELGKPYIELSGKSFELSKKENFKKVHVSLTHLKDIASSVVIIEK